MSEDALKLTTYFGERSRVHGCLLADELLEIHGRHEIHSSILLRGIQGFGAKHRLRTDRLLTLSEDLPLVSVAVDTREKIEALLAEVSTIGNEGLVTLERATLDIQPELSDIASNKFESLHNVCPKEPSLAPDEAVKLTIYLGRHERANGSPTFAAVCQTLHESGVAGATVLLGVDGTRDGVRQRARFFARNANVPLMIVSVGDPRRVASAIPHVAKLLREPLYTIERVRVCKRDGLRLQPPHCRPPAEEYGGKACQKLTIITSEAASHENRPVHLELVKRLRMAAAAGATSLRGIWGFHGDHAPHGDRLLAIRRHVPVVTILIDTPDRISKLFPIVDELTRKQGLVTSEIIPVSKPLHATPGL